MSQRAAIVDLLGRYAFGYDQRNLQMLEDCFAEDSVMRLSISGVGPVGPFDGKQAILKLMTDSLETQNDQRRHVTTNIWFEDETEDAATVVSYLTIGSVTDGKLTMLSTGYYRDRVVKQDGRWRFLERDLSLDAPY